MKQSYVQRELKSQSSIGLIVAAVIIIIWIVTLLFLGAINLELVTLWGIIPGILGRTFIQTGLFILAHDAIHGSVSSSHPRLNQAIGRLAVTLYGFLSYQQLSIAHWQHHRHPGQLGKDPDFHEGSDRSWFVWYLKFMLQYVNFKQISIQILGLGTLLIILYYGCHFPLINLCLFWVMPIFLSTMQLFFFGTYLPHRSSPANISNLNFSSQKHQVNSSNYPPILSFLTCYHFGYHWEHHEYPFLPWYQLPFVRKRQT